MKNGVPWDMPDIAVHKGKRIIQWELQAMRSLRIRRVAVSKK